MADCRASLSKHMRSPMRYFTSNLPQDGFHQQIPYKDVSTLRCCECRNNPQGATSSQHPPGFDNRHNICINTRTCPFLESTDLRNELSLMDLQMSAMKGNTKVEGKLTWRSVPQTPQAFTLIYQRSPQSVSPYTDREPFEYDLQFEHTKTSLSRMVGRGTATTENSSGLV